MTTTETEQGKKEGEVTSPPYVSFVTLKNAIEKMAREGGVPSQVDRSYLSNLPGSTQAQLIAAMKWLGLIDAKMMPTDLLEGLVEQDERDRVETFKAILGERYPAATALPPLATQQQLENVFRDMGLTGSTMRKGVAFFLAAAKFSDLAVSPHFKTPRVTNGERKPRKTADKTGGISARATVGGTAEIQQARGQLHPLIQGLIMELPPPNAAFPKTKQEDWLELARVTFRLIYKADDAAPPRVHEEDQEGDSD